VLRLSGPVGEADRGVTGFFEGIEAALPVRVLEKRLIERISHGGNEPTA